MLFLYGNLGNTIEFSNLITSIFKPITEGRLKFVQDKACAICHFTSKEKLEDLTKFFDDIFDDNISAFILIEKSAFGFSMSDDMANHLFDLNQMTGYENYSKLLTNPFEEDFLRWVDKTIIDLGVNEKFRDKIEDDDEGLDLSRIRASYKEPLRVDTILDKISISGYTSLNVEEKNFLKKISEK